MLHSRTARSLVILLASSTVGLLATDPGASARPSASVPSARITLFPLAGNVFPLGLTAGPDGNLWVAGDVYLDPGGGYARVDPNTGASAFFGGGGSDGYCYEPLIAAGGDGNVWSLKCLWYAHGIQRITPSGEISTFNWPGTAQVTAITTGPDGDVWFTESDNRSKLDQVDPSGAITRTSVTGLPKGITTGPDGALWFSDGDQIGRLIPGGRPTYFPLPTDVTADGAIASGSDGNLWFVDGSSTPNGHASIGRMTTLGVVTEFSVPRQTQGIRSLVAGPDGALWFTEQEDARIGSVTTGGVFTLIKVPDGGRPYDIAAGPDGNVWFVEATGALTNEVARVRVTAP
jgi:streptogramin lyase